MESTSRPIAVRSRMAKAYATNRTTTTYQAYAGRGHTVAASPAGAAEAATDSSVGRVMLVITKPRSIDPQGSYGVGNPSAAARNRPAVQDGTTLKLEGHPFTFCGLAKT